MKAPRLIVKDIVDKQRQEIEIQSKESGTKQPDTELIDRLDHWIQYLQDVQEVIDQKNASDIKKKEDKLRVKDKQDDMLYNMNAKRALDLEDDEKGEKDEDEDSKSRTNSRTASNSQSQRPALKRRRELPCSAKNSIITKEDLVEIMRMDKNTSMSKEDWKEVLVGDSEVRDEVNALKAVVEQVKVEVDSSIQEVKETMKNSIKQIALDIASSNQEML